MCVVHTVPRLQKQLRFFVLFVLLGWVTFLLFFLLGSEKSGESVLGTSKNSIFGQRATVALWTRAAEKCGGVFCPARAKNCGAMGAHARKKGTEKKAPYVAGVSMLFLLLGVAMIRLVDKNERRVFELRAHMCKLVI